MIVVRCYPPRVRVCVHVSSCTSCLLACLLRVLVTTLCSTNQTHPIIGLHRAYDAHCAIPAPLVRMHHNSWCCCRSSPWFPPLPTASRRSTYSRLVSVDSTGSSRMATYSRLGSSRRDHMHCKLYSAHRVHTMHTYYAHTQSTYHRRSSLLCASSHSRSASRCTSLLPI